MGRILKGRRPSPAMIISVIALIVAVGGSTFAIAASDNKKDKKIASKVVTKRCLARDVSLERLRVLVSLISPCHLKFSLTCRRYAFILPTRKVTLMPVTPLHQNDGHRCSSFDVSKLRASSPSRITPTSSLPVKV